MTESQGIPDEHVTLTYADLVRLVEDDQPWSDIAEHLMRAANEVGEWIFDAAETRLIEFAPHLETTIREAVVLARELFETWED